VHLTINRGVENGTFNLIWNEYAGAPVTSYVILRGASPTTLSQIATLASSNTSYTDRTPADSEPYYAIEYMLSTTSAAPAKAKAKTTATLSGRSNIVDKRNTQEGIEKTIDPSLTNHKLLINGVLYILRGDKIYTSTGQSVETK
jgi:hypothetical protein